MKSLSKLIHSGLLLQFAFLFFISTAFSQGTGNVTVTGELKKWHKIVLSIDGPTFSETSTTNPFTDYRLNVTFTNGSNSFVVPGFFAADGNAAETSASSGNVWRVNFAPNATGTWNYTVSFRTGTDVAASIISTDGTAVAPLDGVTGSFTVGATDKTAPDLRARGRLNYVSEHYYQFAETGDYFVKGGVDSPENMLAYQDFDGTVDEGGQVNNFLHAYGPHVSDWNTGDPTWQNGKGKGLIGAINYLSDIGINSVYFLSQNVNGDGDDTWPWIASDEVLRYDCSKLDQWEIAMEHMDHKGLFINLVHQEQENDQYLNNGDLGTARKIYYRELVARFGHHLAIQWNMGEECTNTISQIRDFCQYIRDVDPYDRPIVLHTYANNSAFETYYGGLLGNPNFDGTSFQINFEGNLQVHNKLKEWIDRSADAGRKWNVMFDEVHPADTGLEPDADDPGHDDRRKYDLWAVYLAGSGGTEWYVGSEANLPTSQKATSNRDRTLEDFRTREDMWVQTKIAREFMETHIPLVDVENDNNLVSAGICLADRGNIYLVYLPDGGTTTLDLETFDGTYTVQWFDPKNGGAFQNGSITQIGGTGDQSLGNPPSAASNDWAILVTNIAGPDGIDIINFTATPAQVDNENLPVDITFTATVTDEAPGTITSVTLDLTNLGGSSNVAMTPNGDDYSYTFSLTNTSIVGTQQVALTATDNESNTQISTTSVTVLDGGVVLAINVGSTDYTSTEGIEYVKDIYSVGETVSSKTNPIAGTDDDALYQTYAFGDYNINVPVANGTYTLRFQMMEPFATTVGQRVFDISAEGNNLVADVDIFQEVGMFTAYDIIIRDVVVTDGTLNIALSPSANNAILSGLVIYDNDNAPNPTAYTVTVTNGFGSGTFLPGENVQIEANPAPMGQVFDQWTGDTFVLSDPTLVSPIFVMPAQDVSLTATYRDENAVVYTVTVNNGSGSGNYEAGETVSIQADPAPSGQVFDQWTGDIFVLSDPTLSSTNFTMPTQNLSFTATYTTTTTTPTVTFIMPTNNDNFGVGELIEVEVEATDDDGIDFVELFIDGGSGEEFVDRENSAPYDWGANDPVLQNRPAGTYTLRAIATDNTGETGEASITITISGSTPTPPVVTFITPVENQNFTAGTNLFVQVSATDDDGVDFVDLFINDGSGEVFVDREDNPPYTWDESEPALQNLAVGTYTLRAVAVDANGTSGETSITINVVNDPVDCNNDINGSATVICDICVGGNTGLTAPDADMDGIVDCEDSCPNDATNTCTPDPSQTVCLTPTNDAYLQDGSLRNDTMLRIEQDRRISYAMFDLGSIDGTITEATLEVFVTRDDGNGTLEIIKGLSNNWTETTLNTSNAPAEGATLAMLNQNYIVGNTLSIDLDETGLTPSNLNSFILKQTSGNDFSFSSKEGFATPELCLTYTPAPLSIDVRIFLEGAYNGTDMTHLFDDIMPTTEPYTTLGYTHVNGGGGETTTISIINSESIVDWVVVELRDKMDNTQVVASRAALLKSDGRIVSHEDGTSPVTFQLNPDNYYIAVYHRNHLKMMTATTISLD